VTSWSATSRSSTAGLGAAKTEEMDKAHVRDVAIALEPNIVTRNKAGKYEKFMTMNLLANNCRR
jgi:hypothetical protein